MRPSAHIARTPPEGVTSLVVLAFLRPRIAYACSEGPFRPRRPGELFFPPLPETDF